MALLRDKPSTLKEAKALINNLTEYTSVASYVQTGSDLLTLSNSPDDLKGVDIKLSTGLDSQWLQVTEFIRDPWATKETRLRITRPTAAKVKQLLIDKYAPDYHPDKNKGIN